jgi:hypothetical protein
MRKLSSLAIAFGLLFMSQPMQAWFDGGHMLVAYIAYKNLKPNTQKRVDKLIKKNPLYSTWTKGVASKQKGLTAFVMAATRTSVTRTNSSIATCTLSISRMKRVRRERRPRFQTR